MKKGYKIGIGIAVFIALLVGVFMIVFGKGAIKESDFLHVENGQLVTEAGDQVLLQGVNLGGWLIQESWMCPVNGADRKWANLDTLEVLESRFGKADAAKLIATYQDNWITAWDIQNISKMGCNVVRVPFWYRNFMTDTAGNWINENLNENPGFQRLDWVIEQAGKNGMYVILDMHGCPGGQSMDHCCGTLCQNELYTNEVCQATMEKLWVAIADRYKDNPVVAAYDIMNEPQNNGGYEGENSYDPWQKASWEMSNQIYDRMIKAIRTVDNRHVITVEGIWRITNLPDPATLGWENVMYQAHLYDGNEEFEKQCKSIAEMMNKYGVAGYVGEFQNLYGILYCEKNGINWTTWTYKGTDANVDGFFWYYGDGVWDVNLQEDSYEMIMAKWGEVLKTEKFMENTMVTQLIRQATMFDLSKYEE